MGDAVEKPSKRVGLGWLLLLLVLSESLYVALARLKAVNGARPVLVFLALMGGLFALYALAYLAASHSGRHHSRTLAMIGAGAILFRLTLLPAGLPDNSTARSLLAALRADVRGERVAYDRYQLFDDDVWRYLWDGQVCAAGTNPYLYPPADAALDTRGDTGPPAPAHALALWDEIRENISYPEIPTVYPPLAQAVFRLSHWLAPGSVMVMKSLFVGFDLIAVIFLALSLKVLDQPTEGVLLYAWNPLVIKVFAGSGHMDAILSAMIAATAYFLLRGAYRASAVSFGLAVLSKMSALILLPFLFKRVGRRNCALSGAVILAGYIPFLGAGSGLFKGTLTFARDWQFNAGFFALIRWLASRLGPSSQEAEMTARAACCLAILAVVSWLAHRDDGGAKTFAPYGAASLGALIILGPTAMPWYVAWILPLAVISQGVGRRVWIYYSALICLAFLVMMDETEHALTLGLEYGALAGLVWFEFKHAKRRRHELELASTGRCESPAFEGGERSPSGG